MPGPYPSTIPRRPQRLAPLAVALLLGLAFHARAAADWPMFRGNPALTGVAPGSLSDKLTVQWSFKTDGPIKSSAAIVLNRVYVGSGDGHVYGLNLADGTKVWSFKTEAEVESSPLVLDGKVYVGSNDGFLYALDAATGDQVWRFGTEDKIPGSPNWVSAPDGKGKWILAGSYDFRLYSLDAVTGKSNWVFETGNYINGSPAVSGGVTAFGGCDALLHVISLRDGTKVKEVEAGAYIIGSVALDRQQAFIGHYNHEFLCIDLEAGAIKWRYKDRLFPYSSSPAVTADRVVFGGDDKRVHCVDRNSGELRWVFATRGKVESSPVICGDKVVVGSNDGRLYLLSLADGKELWSYDVGQPVMASPAVVDGRVIIGSEDGQIYAFGPAEPTVSAR